MRIHVLAGIIVGSCLVTCGVLYAFHRLGRRDALLVDTTRGAGVYGVVGTSFAVLLAFVVLIAFESYIDARDGAEQEADAVLELARTSEFFPARQGAPIRGELLCYGRAVIHEEWPAMRHQDHSDLVNDWALAVERSYRRLTVDTNKQGWAFGDLLESRDRRIDARRQRLTQAVPIITTPVWFILGIGALLNIAFVLIFVDRRSEALAIQVVLMAAVTAVVVAGLGLIWFLDHPYEDADGSIKPIEMERTVTAMETEDPRLVAPCSPRGEPL